MASKKYCFKYERSKDSMKKNISIIIPSIRPKNLIKVYQSVQKSCSRYKFEIIIPSPYLIPEELLAKENVRFVHAYSWPSVAFQQAALLSNADFIYNTTDDGLLQDGAIDLALDLFYSNELNDNDIINMKYVENVLDPDTLEETIHSDSCHPEIYWLAKAHHNLMEMKGINPEWNIGCQFIMSLDKFYSLNGLNCIFENGNYSFLDLMFRCQMQGYKIINLPIIAYKASYLPERSGDHGPIHDSSVGPDIENLKNIYCSDPPLISPHSYDNWKKYPSVWNKRFNENSLPIKK